MSLLNDFGSFFSKVGSAIANTTEVKYLTTPQDLEGHTGLEQVGLGVAAPFAATIPVVEAALISGASAAKSVSKTIATSATKLISSFSPTTKLGLIAVAPVAAGTLASSSKARNALLNFPKSSISLGSDIGNFIDNPTLTSGKDLVTEHPVASVIAGATALVVGGKAVLSAENVISTRQNTEAIIKNTGRTVVTQIEDDVQNIKAQTKASEKEAENQIDIIETQTKASKELLKAQLEAQEESLKLQEKYRTIQPISEPSSTAPVSTITTPKTSSKKKARKKAKTKPKKKAKKKSKAKSKKKSLNTKKKKKVKR